MSDEDEILVLRRMSLIDFVSRGIARFLVFLIIVIFECSIPIHEEFLSMHELAMP